MKVLQGKKAMVTGAGSGIGREISLALAREGVDLFLLDIDSEGLSKTSQDCRECNANVIERECDIADIEQIDQAVDAMLEKWGDLDLLVNNAGIFYRGRTDQMTRQMHDRLFAVNFHGAAHLIQRLLPVLIAKTEAHILNVCSAGGLVPVKKMAFYSASKHALVGLSLSLRAEYSPGGLGVTTLCPGVVHTNLENAARENDMFKGKLEVPKSFGTTAEHVARRAIQAIRKNKRLVLITPYAHYRWFVHRFFGGLVDRYKHLRMRMKGKRSSIGSDAPESRGDSDSTSYDAAADSVKLPSHDEVG